MQNKFAFFSNFSETIRQTLPPEKQPSAYQALCEFGIYGDLPDDPMLKAMCLMAKSSIYNRGGAPEGNKNASKKQPENNSKTTENNLETTPLETETETETEILKNNNSHELLQKMPDKTEKEKPKKEPARFVPPSVDEVKAYCQERGNSVDPEKFINHYAARGWRYNGNVAMKDWKAAVRTWENKDSVLLNLKPPLAQEPVKIQQNTGESSSPNPEPSLYELYDKYGIPYKKPGGKA